LKIMSHKGAILVWEFLPGQCTFMLPFLPLAQYQFPIWIELTPFQDIRNSSFFVSSHWICSEMQFSLFVLLLLLCTIAYLKTPFPLLTPVRCYRRDGLSVGSPHQELRCRISQLRPFWWGGKLWGHWDLYPLLLEPSRETPVISDVALMGSGRVDNDLFYVLTHRKWGVYF